MKYLILALLLSTFLNAFSQDTSPLNTKGLQNHLPYGSELSSEGLSLKQSLSLQNLNKCKYVIEPDFSLENNLYLLGASATFITFDYIGYNSWGQYYENQDINPYRVVQVIVQAGITYGLAKLTKGWQVPVAFNFIWITGGMDYGYYGLSEITDGFGLKNWEGRGTYARSSLSHMDWTLIGWFYPQSQSIPKTTYENQAKIGAVIGFMAINMKFNF